MGSRRLWLILCVGIALYAALKSYPVDYDAEGNILVDGAKMAADTFKGCGLGESSIVGWFFYYVLTLILLPPVVFFLSDPFGTVATNFVAMLYITWLFPWLISKYEQRAKAGAPTRTASHFKTA